MKGALRTLLLLIPTIASAAEGSLQEYSFFSSFVQMIAALAIVVGLIFVTWHFSGKLMKGLPLSQRFAARHIRVVETCYLAPKRSVVLVEVGGEYLLLSSTDQGVSLIKRIDMLEEIEVVEEHDLQGGFAAVLARLRKTA